MQKTDTTPSIWKRYRHISNIALGSLFVLGLLCLAIANIVVRSSWIEVEDGVLWVSKPEGLTAQEIDPGSAAANAGIQIGDVLLAINGRPVDSTDEVLAALHASESGATSRYAILSLGSQTLRDLTLQRVPSGNQALYFVLAILATFTLLVGAVVVLRQSRKPATLHFFWLTVAFFGVFAFSFSGRLDWLDWIFYWIDIVALLLLAPLFMHFALVFPERSPGWLQNKLGRSGLSVLYGPAVVLGGLRTGALWGSTQSGIQVTQTIEVIERLEVFYLLLCISGGAVVMIHALRKLQSVTARRQLRWIIWGTLLGCLPFMVGYLIPWVLGFNPPPQMGFTAVTLGLVPLAFASAITRYRLMDVDVIVKWAVVYSAAILTIVGIYTVLLRIASEMFLGGSRQYNSIVAVLATLVVVLLAAPVKNAIQAAFDRVYYRDRYDYRRALIGFARDLNRDLNLERLSERLVTRVTETFVVERMALLLAPLDSADQEFRVIHAVGFDDPIPRLSRKSAVGERLGVTRALVLDELAKRIDSDDVEVWLESGVHYIVPSVSKDKTLAVIALGRKESGEPLSSEDLSLLEAVAAQVATALENGRLYGQLRAKAEELDRLRELSENVIESLNDGLAVVGLDDRVIRWNQGLEKLYGVERKEAIGQTLASLFDPSVVHMFQEARKESPMGAIRYRVPMTSRHKEGGQRLLINAATAPLRAPDGGLGGTIIILEDISTRVRLEEQLQISEKMASVGLLAAGVAHEVNTPLTGISSFTQMLLEGADSDDPKTKVLEKIERQTFRAAKIVNGLLNLARPIKVETGPVDVNAVVNEVLVLLEHQLKTSHISVRKDLVSPSPIATGLDYKLQQVFLNLFLNARDAMPKGGWLSIETRRHGDRVVIKVGDTGKGISADHLSRIYDPFYTTKELGQGTGLGLSITYGIVQEHDGTIECESIEGQGTRFSITFPLTASVVARQGDLSS